MKINRINSCVISVTKFIFNILWLIRVPIVSVSLFLLVDSFKLAGYSDLVLPCMSTMFMLFAGYIINDILDIDIDAVSAPKRPLPSGSISIIAAKIICISCLCLALLFAFLLGNLGFFLYIVVYAIMFWIYTKYLKSNWVIKNGVTAFFFSSMALIPAFFDITLFSKLFLLFAVAFIFTFGREILMDVRDLDGDKIILKQKRLSKKISLCLSTFLLLFSFLTMEIAYLSFSILRYATAFFLCATFIICFKRRRKVWLCTEIVKILFLINLLFLLMEI